VPKRSAKRLVARIAAACLLALAASSCSSLEKKGEGVAEVRIIVGDVSISLGNESYPVSVGMRLMPHNALITKEASKAKVSSGGINIFVNEMSLLRFLPPIENDSCVLAAESGAYYFAVPAGGRSVLCRFGDMTIRIAAGTFAALTIDASGRIAEFFVLGGRAIIKRGAESKELSSCDVVVLDAAGISEDEAVTGERNAAIERLRNWVGETVVDKAIAHGMCKPDHGAVSGDTQTVWRRTVQPPEARPASKDIAARPAVQAMPVDSLKSAAQSLQFKQIEDFMIEQIVGPRRIYAGEEFTLKCGTSGRAAVTKYVWRFDGAGDLLISKTDVQQVTTVIEKTGEFLVTCEIMGDKGTLAAQTVKIGVVPGGVSVSAGGPYKTTLNKPVNLLGEAKSRKGQITRYEWHISNSGKPDYVMTENAAVSHTFTKSGDHKAVFTVRLADGSAASDTATVSVTSLRPTANAGADVVPKSDGKVWLIGMGSSPNGKIVKYEWDFDGDGVFDWSSESSGEVERVFKTYASPVFRVTDADGNTATDTIRVIICPQDMAAVGNGKFCVDKYEWPNLQGATPLTNVSWHEAAKTCESVGKRLCAPDEWKRACRNGSKYKSLDGNSYPYGDEYVNTKCNTLGNPKSKNALMPTGAFSECVGALGIYDMSGNAAEWTSSNTAKAQALGGFYQSGADESDCESGVTLDKDKKYLYTGFRCCK
jgi:hypothetical protein